VDGSHRAVAVKGIRHVLVVAGTDSSGGAGLSRDIETLAAFGLPACPAITAVTIQTHGETRRIEPVPAELIVGQIRAALEANDIAAIKIGMLVRDETVAAVVAGLRRCPGVPVVLDPVLAASSGGALLDGNAIARLKGELMPVCTLVTPNLDELAVLGGASPASDLGQALRQGQVLLDAGCRAVLVKGGHGTGVQATDALLRPGHAPRKFTAPRLAGAMRGTGCMLSSACAAGLAAGLTLERAVRDAKEYVFRRIAANATACCGPGPSQGAIEESNGTW